MYIEDIILVASACLPGQLTCNTWDAQLIHSFTDQITRGVGFTDKQRLLAIKVVKRNSEQLSTLIGKDILSFAESPAFKFPARHLNNTKKISIIPDSVYGKVIKMEFPYNESYVSFIRSIKRELTYAIWDKEQSAWFFALEEKVIRYLSELIADSDFQVDDEFSGYVAQLSKILSDTDNYIPMLGVDQQGVPYLKNTSKYVPELSTTDLLASVFEARKRGVLVWDNCILDYVNSSAINPVTRDFLKEVPVASTYVDCNSVPIDALTDIVTHLSPCLFIVPGGSEMAKLSIVYPFLKSIGIKNSDISVMFRLPKETDNGFNDYVRQHGINTPVSSNTKIVFVSTKLPKPLVQSNIKFHSVIDLGFGGVHYSIKEFVYLRENLIFYSEKHPYPLQLNHQIFSI